MAQSRKSSALWRRSAIAVAVGLSVVSGASFAQSNATGNIFGQVQVVAGTTVVVENTATGAKRVLTPDANGRFVASALPTGMYKVTLMRDGKAVSTQDNVEVTLGQGKEVQFAGTGGAVQTVQVVGKVSSIDVSSTTTGATFTAKQLAALPVGNSIDAIVQLAPNTTRVDSRYSGGQSFGGGAASENSYYINGFPVTNPLTQLGSSELPFGSIAQAQVQVGGFGVEFGRSVGGVVNIISKSGTNNWEAGAALSYAPDSLRGSRKNIYWPKTGANPTTDGKLYLAREKDHIDEYTGSAYVGGPLIEDTLFFFAGVEKRKTDSGRVVWYGGNSTLEAQSAKSGWSDRTDETNRYLTKFDWNITNDHHLELTLLGDRYSRDEKLYGFDYTTLTHNNVLDSTHQYTNDPDNTNGVGAYTKILKYTGYLTDDLTLQVLAGKSNIPHPQSLSGYDASLPQVVVEGNGAFPGYTYNNLQSYSDTIASTQYKEEIKANRIDLEYRLGDHTLRGGIDSVKLSSLNAGSAYAGGRIITYSATDDATYKQNGMTDMIGNTSALQSGGLYYYGTEAIYSTISNAYSDQNAQYLEDKWQATKDLVLTLGLRNEQYKNKSSDGQVFLKVKDQITPRASFVWDVNGDASMKVFGSLGRYAVQIPTGIALRGANSSLYTQQVFAYTGVAADGTPTGRVNLGPAYSANNEYGQPKDLRSVSALDMKPNLQDELSLGIEKSISEDLNAGARFTYRRLASTIDDFCDPRPFIAYANDHGITDADGNPFTLDGWANGQLNFSCAAFNPGKGNTFLVDFKQDGNYQKVYLSKEALGFPTAKRTYVALDFFAEHPLKDGWYGKINYTWSQNKGNTEGQTNSDLGQGDIAQTVSWDHKELMEGSYGYLPNDRRHQIKAYGFVEVTPELQVGANVLLASGRPRSCLGVYPNGNDDFETYINYGSYYHYCGGKLSPRGSQGFLPWDKELDLNVIYKPSIVKGLALRADIFNVFNTQVVQNVYERGETSGGAVNPAYTRPYSFTPERKVKFTVSYDHTF